MHIGQGHLHLHLLSLAMMRSLCTTGNYNSWLWIIVLSTFILDKILILTRVQFEYIFANEFNYRWNNSRSNDDSSFSVSITPDTMDIGGSSILIWTPLTLSSYTPLTQVHKFYSVFRKVEEIKRLYYLGTIHVWKSRGSVFSSFKSLMIVGHPYRALLSVWRLLIYKAKF